MTPETAIAGTAWLFIVVAVSVSYYLDRGQR